MAKNNKKTENNQKYTALYIRVSTNAQFEEGYSVDAQEKRLKAWCESRDISRTKSYIDGGWSGSNLNRPEMQKLIADIKDGKVDTVVVYKLDRLSRSQKDTIYLLEDVFDKYDVSFVSINESFDTTTPYGKAMVGILSVFAQLERENIRDRTRMGMLERLKSGLWRGGGSPPFGYDYNRESGVLIPNKHADDVKTIFDLYLQGYSTTKLANMFPVCSDRQITEILRRITYLGKIKNNGEIFDGCHEPIIDEETWNRVQSELEKRSTKSVTNSEHLLTGLLYCGNCGAKMRYQKWGTDGNGNPKYKIYCYSQQKSKPNLVHDPNCSNLKIPANELEKTVLDELFKMTDNYVAVCGKGSKSSRKEDGLLVLERNQKALEEKIKRLYNLYADKGDDPLLLQTIEDNKAEYAEILKSIEVEKSAIYTEDNDNTLKMVMNLRNRWKHMTMYEKHQVLRATISKIIIDGKNVTINFNI